MAHLFTTTKHPWFFDAHWQVRKCLLLILVFLSSPLANANHAAETQTLWSIGGSDNTNGEFALAPNRYAEFRHDGFYAVGQSDSQRDWPYVHPGPQDGWAGGRKHTFRVLFGLEAAPNEGACQLHLDLLDTQHQIPPRLQIRVNGQQFAQQLPPGAGDASVFGDPSKGREYVTSVSFPANLLRPGMNEISLTTQTGSWLLYDSLSLETPPGLALTQVTGTIIGSIESPPVLTKMEDRLQQILRIPITHLGEPQTAKVHVENLEPTTLTLDTTTQEVEVAIPAVDRDTEVAVRVEVGGKTLATEQIEIHPVRKWVVYLLPHSHVDIGYTHVQTDVEQAQWRYLETAIDTARATADYPEGSRFKWNVEVLWAVDSYLRQATPEKRQAFIEAVQQGQIGLQALYGNELTGLCSSEELLRLLRCSQQIAKLCNHPAQTAMITDVPGYTWGIVPALVHSGVKYFSIGPNGGDRIGHTSSAWGDKPFWWIGPNGQDKVLVWMTGTGYYQVFQSPERLLGYLKGLDDRDYPYDYVQVRHCLGDNAAPDVNFPQRVREWNERYAYPKLVIATTDEMFQDFERRYGDVLPLASGDFTPYWEDGAGSSARETALNRASAERLIQAEALFALLAPEQYPAERFSQAWRNVLLYDEHTWGAHNSVREPDHPFVHSQWAIKQAFALDADQQSQALLNAALATRGEPVESPEGANAIDVFNTAAYAYPWSLVVVPPELSTAGDAVVRSPNSNAEFISQRLTTGELIFRPCASPYARQRFYIRKGDSRVPANGGARVEGTTLTAPRSGVAAAISVRVDQKTGAIISLVYDDDEFVDANAPSAANEFFYLPGTDLSGLQRSGPVTISVKERGPLVASLLVESEAPGCRKLTSEIRVHALRNYVEIVNTIDKLPIREKEGVHFGFGFHVPDGTVRMEVPWAVVRPETDQIPGACKNWFTVQRWVDISNEERGITWITPDAPLVEVGGITANLIGSLSNPSVWLDHLEPSQTIYSWAMNNHWHTNYRAEQEGPTTFRYILWPHGTFDQGRVFRTAIESTQPLVVTAARGELLKSVPFTLSNSNVLVSALKPSEDGHARIIRLFGSSGQKTTTRLKWNEPKPSSIWLSDNSEQPLAPLPESIEIPAYGIITIRAENTR